MSPTVCTAVKELHQVDSASKSMRLMCEDRFHCLQLGCLITHHLTNSGQLTNDTYLVAYTAVLKHVSHEDINLRLKGLLIEGESLK